MASVTFDQEKAAGIKFMQVLDPKIYNQMRRRAKSIGITVQELIKVRAVPEFLFGPVTLNPLLIKQLERNGCLSHQSKVNGAGKKKK